MIRALILDLDNCLSAADEVGGELLKPVFDAIRKANRGRLSEEVLSEAFSECWRSPLDVVADKYGFSKEMTSAAWEVSVQLEVSAPMRGYSDLHTLSEFSLLRFLVTSGFRRLQESKIRALGFAEVFTAIYIDAIDEAGRKGKQGLFAQILGEHQLRPAEVLVVGDNPDSEIEAGRRLGIHTVQILRPGVSRGTTATFYIESLAELHPLIAGNTQ